MQNRSLQTIIFPSIVASTLFFQGCSQHEVLHESETHLYDTNFGTLSAYQDIEEEQRILAQNEAVYTSFRSHYDDPSLTTELTHDPEAFTLDQWVEPEPVITYKYMHSSKFFKEDELPENKLLTPKELDRY